MLYISNMKLKICLSFSDLKWNSWNHNLVCLNCLIGQNTCNAEQPRAHNFDWHEASLIDNVRRQVFALKWMTAYLSFRFSKQFIMLILTGYFIRQHWQKIHVYIAGLLKSTSWYLTFRNYISSKACQVSAANWQHFVCTISPDLTLYERHTQCYTIYLV